VITAELLGVSKTRHATLTDIHVRRARDNGIATETLGAIFCAKVLVRSAERGTLVQGHGVTRRRAGIQGAGADGIGEASTEAVRAYGAGVTGT